MIVGRAYFVFSSCTRYMRREMIEKQVGKISTKKSKEKKLKEKISVNMFVESYIERESIQKI